MNENNNIFEEYYEVKTKIKQLQNREKFLREMLISEFGEGVFQHDQFTLEIKKKTQRRLDTKKVRELIPEEKLDDYLKTVEYFTVGIKIGNIIE